MEKRELLLDSMDALLSEMHDDERSLATRAAGLISATTISLLFLIALRQNRIAVPTWLVVSYGFLALVSAISMFGRRLNAPTGGLDWRNLWNDLTPKQVEDRLFEAKKIAAIANNERLCYLRVMFAFHIFLVSLTVVEALLYLGRTS